MLALSWLLGIRNHLFIALFFPLPSRNSPCDHVVIAVFVNKLLVLDGDEGAGWWIVLERRGERMMMMMMMMRKARRERRDR
jgi:hypothetical protein